MPKDDIWAKAPKEATHYSEETFDLLPAYYLVEGNEVVSMWLGVEKGETLAGGGKLDQGYRRFDYNEGFGPDLEYLNLINRPQSDEWTPTACEELDTVDKGVTMNTYLKNTSLIFGHDRFHGGRLDKKGDGIVEVCFQAMDGEVNIVLFDNMSKEDGHYSPVCLTKEQAETLRDWLTYKLEEMK